MIGYKSFLTTEAYIPPVGKFTPYYNETPKEHEFGWIDSTGRKQQTHKYPNVAAVNKVFPRLKKDTLEAIAGMHGQKEEYVAEKSSALYAKTKSKIRRKYRTRAYKIGRR